VSHGAATSPLGASGPGEPARTRGELIMLTERSHSVLSVEDERIVAKDLQQSLTGMGYDAFAIASTGDEARSRS
jgi:hypothetical protein